MERRRNRSEGTVCLATHDVLRRPACSDIECVSCQKQEWHVSFWLTNHSEWVAFGTPGDTPHAAEGPWHGTRSRRVDDGVVTSSWMRKPMKADRPLAFASPTCAKGHSCQMNPKSIFRHAHMTELHPSQLSPVPNPAAHSGKNSSVWCLSWLDCSKKILRLNSRPQQDSEP